MRLLVKCPVFPTEDRSLIIKALENLFPNLQFKISNDIVHAATDNMLDIDWLRTRIFEQRIIDAVRSLLRANQNEFSTHILLDKQFALSGRVRVIDDTDGVPPLGAIELQCLFDNHSGLDYFISWLTPPTKNGHIVI